MRIGVLTSTDTRHRYFVNRLRDAFDVAAVGYEQTGYDPRTSGIDELTPQEAAIVHQHFTERTAREKRFFGNNAAMMTPGGVCSVNHLQPGELNSEATLRLLSSAGVDTVVVYGTNLIGTALLERFFGRMVNMHLGLSPYYRGTGTNFYPLLNEEPEYVGATIHLLDVGIDSGPILRHTRPTITEDDMPHTIGCKAILSGIDAMISALQDMDRGRVTPVPQWNVPGGRLYLRKDYHPRQVVQLYEKLEAGLIPKYIARTAHHPTQIRLVE